MRGVAALFVLAVALSLAARAEPPERLGRIEFIGYAALPTGTVFDGTTVGGLSGLSFDPESGLYWAISDDRSEKSPARLYRLRVDLADGRLDPGDLQVASVSILSDPQGAPFARRTIDAEGIALGGERVFISSEGEAGIGQPPFVAEFDREGRWRRALALPDRFVPRGKSHGPRDNQVFEALTLTPDRRHLFVGVEGALWQDGPDSDVGVTSRTRLRRIDLAQGERESEFLYPLEAVSKAPVPADGLKIHGLVELLALDAERLLALEREFVAGGGHRVRLYEIALATATDVATPGPAPAEAQPAAKRLLLELAETGQPIENVEGMTFGPPLPDGRLPLLLIADDNFLPHTQGTQLFAFAVSPEVPTIARVQGLGHRSPWVGQWVVDLAGVVTAVDRAPRTSGFWLESPTPDPDPDSSEGLFVAAPVELLPAVGTAVAVHGRVAEVESSRGLSVTQVALRSLAVFEQKVDLPEPVALFRARTPPAFQIDDDGLARFEPNRDAIDFWESLEGMRVTIPSGVVVGPSNEYGDLALLPEGVEELPRTPRGGVRLDERGANQRRVLLGRRLAGALPVLPVGARLAGPIDAIVDYAFSNYRVWPLAEPAVAQTIYPCMGEGAAPAAEGELTLASFNVENLAASSPAEKFDRLARQIVAGLGSPAIVALQEIQDDSGPADDGVVSAAGTLARLAAAVTAAGGPAYEAVAIDPQPNAEGGQPGGNIRVAFLFDPRRALLPRRGQAGALDVAEVVGRGAEAHLAPNPGRVAATSPAFTLSNTEGVRRSLAVEFEVGKRRLFLVNNHWSSKFADDRAFGARQPPQRPTDAFRLAQAREIRAFAERLLAADPQALLVILGDFNDFEWTPPLQTLGAAPLELLTLRLPPERRYSFNFEGSSQLIDHAVASPAAARGAVVEIVHLNTDCPDAERASDHDPFLLRLRP